MGLIHGTNSFSGTIGKALASLSTSDHPIQSFQKIEGNPLPAVDFNALSVEESKISAQNVSSHKRWPLFTRVSGLSSWASDIFEMADNCE